MQCKKLNRMSIFYCNILKHKHSILLNNIKKREKAIKIFVNVLFSFLIIFIIDTNLSYNFFLNEKINHFDWFLYIKVRIVRTDSRMVRVKGLEPPWISPLDPKSSASANSAIPAKNGGPCRTRTYNRPVMSRVL